MIQENFLPQKKNLVVRADCGVPENEMKPLIDLRRREPERASQTPDPGSWKKKLGYTLIKTAHNRGGLSPHHLTRTSPPAYRFKIITR